ncbi:MAG TPA: protein kinase [Gemmatimonadaceae bacterium]|nr:protein kinase [Gemmatimonadaceae bacterium]
MSDRLKDRVVAAVGDLYDVEAEIGRGGSAVVYRAVDVRLRRRVALKVLPPELAFRDEVRSRFLREAQTAAQLGHPNIVPIYTVDEREGLVYFVMGLVEGESVAGLLRREPRPPLALVRRVLQETADALAFAHARGVVHRDIKPDNILLDRESGRAMVTDFGIARALEGEARLTVTGVAVGTPAYMSPEQALGEREVDARSDIYSLGVVGYLMVAGELPFRATNTPAMLMKHISELPPPLLTKRPDLPAPLRETIERALRKKPEERWPSAAAMRDALRGEAGALPARVPDVVPAPVPPAAGHAAERLGDPFPALPPLPPFPRPNGGPNSREVWRQQQRLWREQVRRQREARRAAGLAHPQGTPSDGAADGVPMEPGLQERFDAFRRKLTSTVFFVVFLAFINLVTFPFFPWVVFPGMAAFGRLRRRWLPLAAAGVTLNDVWAGRLPPHLGGRDPKVVRLEAKQRMAQARLQAREAAKRGRVLVQWRDMPTLVKRIRRFRAGAFTAAGAAGVAAVSLAIGAPAGIDALAVPFVLGSMTAAGAGLYTAIAARRVRRAGLRLREMLRDNWMERLKAADPRPRAAVIEEEVARLVPPDVLAGPHGETVRRAVADRAEVSDTFAKMSPTDRALLPDVTATVDALVGRVAMLAQALHRLDEDHPSAMLAALEERLARAEAESTDTRDGERRLALLQRQRETLQDLVKRRETLAGQLEHAALVLQSVRFDLLKLRSAGIQSALEDVTSATQEARALSREIGHVLDAAAEVRAL